MTQAQKSLGVAALGLAVLALITGVVFFTRQNEGAVPEPGLQAAIRSSVDRAPYTRWHGLYQERAYTPIWLLPSGPSSDARAVMTLLAHAGDQGLSAARYRVDDLPPKGASKQTVAAFEMRLTRAAFAYAHDMQFGVLRPTKLFDDVSLAPRKDDSMAQFEQAVSQGDVADYLQSLEPQVGEYRGLKRGWPPGWRLKGILIRTRWRWGRVYLPRR
jgi:murein L,D-transpeptidase YcbB/YkuD